MLLPELKEMLNKIYQKCLCHKDRKGRDHSGRIQRFANFVVHWNMQGIMWQDSMGKDIMPDIVYMDQLLSRKTV